MRVGWGRIVLAVVAVSFACTATPAHAMTSLSKQYVAAGGGPTTEHTPFASCDNGNRATSVGGACFTVPGDTIVHVEIHDAASPVVAAYWNVDMPGTFFCTSADIAIPTGTHTLGIWVGGANALSAGCAGLGQATSGTVTISY